MTMGPIQKAFMVLRPFEGALIYSILIEETQVMLRKANFSAKVPNFQFKAFMLATYVGTGECFKFVLQQNSS
jgi:hypothetical protein